MKGRNRGGFTLLLRLSFFTAVLISTQHNGSSGAIVNETLTYTHVGSVCLTLKNAITLAWHGEAGCSGPRITYRTYNASSCVIVGQGISARYDISLPPLKEIIENVYTGKKTVIVKELGIVRYTVYNGELCEGSPRMTLHYTEGECSNANTTLSILDDVTIAKRGLYAGILPCEASVRSMDFQERHIGTTSSVWVESGQCVSGSRTTCRTDGTIELEEYVNEDCSGALITSKVVIPNQCTPL